MGIRRGLLERVGLSSKDLSVLEGEAGVLVILGLHQDTEVGLVSNMWPSLIPVPSRRGQAHCIVVSWESQ